MTRTVKQWVTGRLADTPVDDAEPDTWEEANTITQSDISRQLNDRGEPPPNFLTPFAKRIQPVMTQPSDSVFMQSFIIDNTTIVPLVGQQDKGSACRVTISNWSAAGGLWIATRGDLLTTGLTALTQLCTQGFMIFNRAAGPPIPFMFQIASGLLAVAGDANAQTVSVMLETYNPDAYDWNYWLPGQGSD